MCKKSVGTKACLGDVYPVDVYTTVRYEVFLFLQTENNVVEISTLGDVFEFFFNDDL
jgi:hypothetical protein